MPPLDVEEMSADSSDALDLDVTQPEQADKASKPDAEAVSSPATGEKEEKDLLSVVRDVVGTKAEPDKSDAASPAEGAETGSEDDGKLKKADDEDYSDAPFHKHPRFQHLLRKAKANETDAVRYRNVQTFLDTNGLSAEEASDGLIIMSLIKTNPAEAWRQMKPIVQKLLVAAGEVLPDDLQTRVQTGEISHDGALEIARARAKAQSVRAHQSFQQQREERQRQMDLGNSITNAVNEWENDRRLKDPNFDAKLTDIRKEIVWMHTTEGQPTTPEGVKEQLRRAYKAVNDRFAPPQPTRPVATKRPVTGGQVAGNTRPTEMSTLDIIRQHTAGR